MLAADRVRWGPHGLVLVDDVSLHVPSGSTVGLVGPNGSGKSSLLRVLAGLRPPVGGTVCLGGRPLADWDRRELARELAVVQQEPGTDTDMTVTEAVGLGRAPHRSLFAAPSDGDARATRSAIDRLGLGLLADRRWSTLSGGEHQRAHLARALAQGTPTLLLDEPTNHLDVRHQVEVLTLLADAGLTVIAALHDLALAAAHCDQLVVLSEGRVVTAGAPREALTAELVEQVWGVRCVVEEGTVSGRLVLTYLHP